MNKNMLYAISLVLTSLSLSLHAGECGRSYLELDTGYRYDRIDETIEEDNTAGIALTGNFQYKNMQSYQLGARGMWFTPYCDLVVIGAGHYGWVTNGRLDNFAVLNASLSSGHTWDAWGAIGYQIPCGYCFNFVPLIGFSYDAQRVHIGQISTSEPSLASGSPGFKLETDFYGPLIGFDCLFASCFCDLTFDVGYEFHYGWARKKIIADTTIPALNLFSYKGKIHDMKGHVFHIEGHYPFWCNWLCGLRLQYTFWGNSHKQKDTIPGPAETGLPPTVSQITRAFTWHSFALTFNLGYHF